MWRNHLTVGLRSLRRDPLFTAINLFGLAFGLAGCLLILLFIRYELTIHLPLAENDQAGRALGRERFDAFVTQVGRHVASGRRTLVATETER